MIILLVIMHAALASIFPIGRVVSEIAAPVFFTAVRMTIAGLLIIGYQRVRHGRFSPKIAQAMGVIVAFTITGIYLTNVPELWALQYLPAAKASFIYSLSPFAAAILSYVFFQEKMTLKKLLGMGIGLVGFMIMLIHTAPGESSNYSIGFFSLAEVALIIAAIMTACGWIILRRKIHTKTSLMFEILGLSMLLGGGLCFITSALVDSWSPLPITDYANNGFTFIICLILAVLFSNLLGYTLYTALLRSYTATFISFTGFLQPLFAALYGWVFLDEMVTRYFFFSALLVFIGLYIFYTEELRQGYFFKHT